jgi:hypothetical protein
MLSLMNRAVGRVVARGDGGTRCRGFTRQRDTAMGGITDNISCVLSGKHSFMPTEPRSQRSLCRACRTRSRLRRGSAKAIESDSSTTERSARAATRWLHGRARQTRTESGGEVSDQFGFISEVGHSSGRRNGAPAECSVRKMAVLTINADVLAGRSLAAYCGVLPVRSIAGYCGVLGDMRSIAPILPVRVGRSLATSCFGLCSGSGDAPRTRRLGSLRYIGRARCPGLSRRFGAGGME